MSSGTDNVYAGCVITFPRVKSGATAAVITGVCQTRSCCRQVAGWPCMEGGLSLSLKLERQAGSFVMQLLGNCF